jgi:Fe-S-cluster-containing dehydrogenase component
MGINRRSALKLMASAGATAAATALPSRADAAPHAVAPADAVGLLYDTTRCIGCQACVVKCNEVNGLSPDPGWSDGRYQAPAHLNARTKNIIKLYNASGQRSFMKRQCMHCIDPACVTACMLGALQKREKGIVWWDGSVCVGCRYCQIACPFNIPKFEWASLNPRIVKCELCRERLAEGKEPGCTEVCPREAVIFGTREALLLEARRRLEEHPDLYVPKIYGEHDGGGTQVLYLSHVPFENLGLPDLGTEAVPETVRNVQGTIYTGFVAPLALFGIVGAAAFRNRKSHSDAADPDEDVVDHKVAGV